MHLPAWAARTYRPVTVVNAGARKALDLRVEIPVEDMARLSSARDQSEKEREGGGWDKTCLSIWQSIYPRLYSRCSVSI